jgi:hypothetical protein
MFLILTKQYLNFNKLIIFLLILNENSNIIALKQLTPHLKFLYLSQYHNAFSIMKGKWDVMENRYAFF